MGVLEKSYEDIWHINRYIYLKWLNCTQAIQCSVPVRLQLPFPTHAVCPRLTSVLTRVPPLRAQEAPLLQRLQGTLPGEALHLLAGIAGTRPSCRGNQSSSQEAHRFLTAHYAHKRHCMKHFRRCVLKTKRIGVGVNSFLCLTTTS